MPFPLCGSPAPCWKPAQGCGWAGGRGGGAGGGRFSGGRGHPPSATPSPCREGDKGQSPRLGRQGVLIGVPWPPEPTQLSEKRKLTREGKAWVSWEPRGLPASWRLLRPSPEALRAAPGPAGAGGRLPGPGSGSRWRVARGSRHLRQSEGCQGARPREPGTCSWSSRLTARPPARVSGGISEDRKSVV